MGRKWCPLLGVFLLVILMFSLLKDNSVMGSQPIDSSLVLSIGSINQILTNFNDVIIGIQCHDTHAMIHTKSNRIILLYDSSLHNPSNDTSPLFVHDQLRVLNSKDENDFVTIFRKKLNFLDEDEDDEEFNQRQENRYLVRISPNARKFTEDVNQLSVITTFVVDTWYGKFYVWKTDDRPVDMSEFIFKDIKLTSIKDFHYNGGLAAWLTNDGQIFYAITSNLESVVFQEGSSPKDHTLKIHKAACLDNPQFKKISVGSEHLLAIDSNGFLYALGSNVSA